MGSSITICESDHEIVASNASDDYLQAMLEWALFGCVGLGIPSDKVCQLFMVDGSICAPEEFLRLVQRIVRLPPKPALIVIYGA